MEQIQRLLASFTLRQKFTLATAALAVLAGLALFLRWNKERDFQTLYSGLSAEDAAAVVARLKESGVEYRLGADGGLIRAPSARIADLRLHLAAAGLPKSGRIGFELFDKTNFGSTEFAEQVNYHRALEGELERSVMTLAEIEQARIHLTRPKESVFLDNRRPAKASVLVKLRPGARLGSHNIQAITHLVASAVEGLAPEMVSLLDAHGNLLNRARHQQAAEDGPGEAALDYRRSIERDLLAKIHSTLEPLLGPEKFRAGVSVECDFSSGEHSEETFDPGRSVMTTSQRTEDIAGAGQPAGVPGTASNLPRPTSRPGMSGQGITRRTENIAYQSSRTVKRVHLPRGTLKRMSVAVILDHVVRYEGAGDQSKRILEAPSPERIKTTRDLIAGVVGLQPERGDQLIVESLPFESTLSLEQPLSMPPPAAPAPTMPSWLPAWLRQALEHGNVVLLGALGAVLLLVLLAAGFVLVRLLRRTAVVTGQRALQAGGGTAALPEGASIEEKIEQQLAAQLANRQKQEQEILNSLHLKLPSASTKKAEVLAKQMADESKKDPQALAQIVQTWMSEADM